MPITYTAPPILNLATNILPGVDDPLASFTVGDGQDGVPAGGTSLQVVTLCGQNIVNKRLLVLREGVELLWTNATTTNDIKRYNHNGLGGFNFDPARPGGQLSFVPGERYDIYIIGNNFNDDV
jgi:hypothetical protein